MGIPLGGGHRAGVMEVSLLHSVWLACEGTSLHSFALYFWHKAFVNSPQHIIKVFTLLQFLTSLSTRKIIFRNSAFLNTLSSTTRGALSSISLTTERVPPLRILLPTFFFLLNLHCMPLYCILLFIICSSWLLL